MNSPFKAFLDRVRAADFTVIREIAPSMLGFAPEVAALLGEADAQVRELALICLNKIGTRSAEFAAIAALLDVDAQVRAQAIRVLHHHVPADPAPLLETFDESADPDVRGQVTLVLAKMGAPPVEVIRRWMEARSLARADLLVAAAHAGSPEARRELTERLASAGAADRRELLELAEDLRATWVLPSLMPLLGDQRPATRVGIDGLAGPQYLRICDLVVNVVARIGAAPLSFQASFGRTYDRAEIEEVRAVLDRMRGEATS